MRTLIPLLLLATVAAAQTPDDRAALPLRFAQASEGVRAQLAADWPTIIREGVERKYCVTNWRLEQTRDGDTVFVATAIERQAARGQRARVENIPCVDHETKRVLPALHAHLGGDCSPSRADLTWALAERPPFDLIACGPGLTAGYVWANYREPRG
jgi:hypothetical protein